MISAPFWHPANIHFSYLESYHVESALESGYN